MRLLQHIRRHFVIRHRHGLALHFVSERVHAARRVIRRARRVRFEEQPAFVQNPEEMIAGINPVRAEHRPRAQLRQRAQLVEHKFFERVVRQNVGENYFGLLTCSLVS